MGEEPLLPTRLSKWERHEERGLTIVGDFVLKEGETTDGNNQLGIKLIKIVPGNQYIDPNDEKSKAKASFQFIKTADGQPFCEAVFTEKSTTPISITSCAGKLPGTGILSASVSVNIKDGWVHVQLIG